MSMYVITRNPSDYPGYLVARRHEILDGNHRATEDHWIHKSIEGLRRHIRRWNPNAVMIPPHPADDPVIVESWL